MNKQQNAVLRCESLCHYYGEGQQRLDVLSQLDFTIAKGERIAIMGSSGAGKSTLLNLLGGLDNPLAGKVWLTSVCLSDQNADQRAMLRNKHLGFVYQFHHLMVEFTALENVAMPCLIAGQSKVEAFRKAEDLLQKVGLGQRLTHRPSQLSGGERQRVAVARALVMQADCVLLDEPTGNLDAASAAQVLTLINDLSAELGTAIVVVTHDQQLADTMDKVLLLRNGRLEPQ